MLFIIMAQETLVTGPVLRELNSVPLYFTVDINEAKLGGTQTNGFQSPDSQKLALSTNTYVDCPALHCVYTIAARQCI
jgi:hypothetical protein